MKTIQDSISRFGSYELRHARTVLERECIAMCANNVNTQAFVGQLELLTAIGAELSARNELSPPVPWVAVDKEDGFRLSFSIYVF